MGLASLGYGDPLPTPTPVVQATLACVSDKEFHEFIQSSDKAALADIDDEGAHAPLMLSVLDLSHWTALMNVVTADKAAGMIRLQKAQQSLAVILDQDEVDLEDANRNTRAVEAYLRTANPHEEWTKEIPAPTVNLNDAASGDCTVKLHPLLSRLNIAPCHKTAIEDLSESIVNTQSEVTREKLEASGKGPSIPFLPPRAVEDLLATRSHRTWCVNNINLLAPITVPMWKMWANMDDKEIKICEDRALNRLYMQKEAVLIPNAFPLAMFDHHKCTTTKVQVLVKQDVITCPPRHKKHSATFWNCQRPYIRCTCEQNATSGCTGTMLWFDHAIWYMINNLESFFDQAYGSKLAGKYGAFITWINGAARQAVRAQITFMKIRHLMATAALEATVNVDGKLLAMYFEAPGAKIVERFVRPAQFSLDTAPSASPSTYKKRKYQNNTEKSPASIGYQPWSNEHKGGRGRGQPRRGRGGFYNKNYRSNPSNDGIQFLDTRQNTKLARDSEGQRPGFQSPRQIVQQRGMPEEITMIDSTPPNAIKSVIYGGFGSASGTGSSAPVTKPWSPIKGRVLDWADL